MARFNTLDKQLYIPPSVLLAGFCLLAQILLICWFFLDFCASTVCDEATQLNGLLPAGRLTVSTFRADEPKPNTAQLAARHPQAGVFIGPVRSNAFWEHLSTFCLFPLVTLHQSQKD